MNAARLGLRPTAGAAHNSSGDTSPTAEPPARPTASPVHHCTAFRSPWPLCTHHSRPLAGGGAPATCHAHHTPLGPPTAPASLPGDSAPAPCHATRHGNGRTPAPPSKAQATHSPSAGNHQPANLPTHSRSSAPLRPPPAQTARAQGQPAPKTTAACAPRPVGPPADATTTRPRSKGSARRPLAPTSRSPWPVPTPPPHRC